MFWKKLIVFQKPELFSAQEWDYVSYKMIIMLFSKQIKCNILDPNQLIIISNSAVAVFLPIVIYKIYSCKLIKFSSI